MHHGLVVHQCARGSPVARLKACPQVTRHGQRAGAGRAAVLDVEVASARFTEAFARVEAVGGTALQCGQLQRQLQQVGLRAGPVHHPGAHALALVRGLDVQVVHAQRSGLGPQRDATDALAALHDVLHVLGQEAAQKALARAGRLEAAQRFQAGLHGADAQRQQRLEVRGRHRLQLEALVGRRPHAAQACAALICSSTSFALTGMGVPGP